MSLSYKYKVVEKTDIQLLSWLYLYHNKPDVTPLMILELNKHCKTIEASLKQLNREGFLKLTWNGDAILELELTKKAIQLFRGVNARIREDQ